MKLVLLAEPFHSFTLTERLDRNGLSVYSVKEYVPPARILRLESTVVNHR